MTFPKRPRALVQLPEPLRRFLSLRWGIALVIAICWQLLMTVLGILLERRFPVHDPATLSLFSHTGYWDGGWYQSIVNGAYRSNPAAPAFFPLFPLAVRTVQWLSGGLLGTLAAGLVVNTLSLWLALTALMGIAERVAPPKYRWWVLVLFLTSPAALFLHMFYSEALFCALAFWAYWFALRRRWGPTVLLLSILTAARLPAVLFIVLCGLELVQAQEGEGRKTLSPHLFYLLITPLGFVVYGVYLYAVRGDFWAMFHAFRATTDWSYHVFNPNFLQTIFREAGDVLLCLTGKVVLDANQLVYKILPVAAIAVLGSTSLYILIFVRKLIPLGVFGLLSLVLFTLNNNVVSVHRYILPCLVIYVAAPWVVERFGKLQPLLYLACALGLILQACLFILFVGGRFAG